MSGSPRPPTAWLTDPHDVQAYGRLVGAIRARRAYLNPTLDENPYDPAAAALSPPEPAPRTTSQPDEVLDGLADQSPVQPLRSTLEGTDLREVLARLRGAGR